VRYRRKYASEGSDVGRDLPADALFIDDAGREIPIECSLDELITLPQSCDELPSGQGVRIKDESSPSPSGSAGRMRGAGKQHERSTGRADKE